jgi:hypothetical protein
MMPIVIEGPFHHRDHVRLAWTAVRGSGLDAALAEVPDAIRAFAAAHGVPEKYHDTLTRCWIRLVAAAVAETPGPSFEAFLDAHPQLLDTALPRRHYSEACLASPRARTGDVAPDLLPLGQG